jgi:formimidoylglutamate deiminase
MGRARMKAFFAGEALLPGGWARDVLLRVDENGDIAQVSPSSPARSAERLAGPVLPGMANLHSHAFQRAMAGLAESRGLPEDDFWSWRELMYRFVSRITPEQAQAVARQLYVEMLLQGYTAVAEFHYVHHAGEGAPHGEPAQMLLRHLEAARESGIAITLLPSLYRWASFGDAPLAARQQRFRTSPQEVLRMVEEIRRALAGDRDARVGVAPHSLRAVDEAALRELVEGLHAMEARAPVHIHAAEQTKEVEDCLAASGKRPVEWLLERMAVDERWCLVHATHMTAQEARALAASGAVAGLCPSTEANLGDGFFPLLEYRGARGAYGIGGDSHVSRDPAEELRLLEYVQRLVHRRRNLVVGEHTPAVGTTLWLEAAAGGARALARPMGALAPGHRADLVVLDAAHPDLASRSGDAVTNSLVFSGGRGFVRDVMVAGRWIVREARHPLAAQAGRDYRRALAELLSN